MNRKTMISLGLALTVGVATLTARADTCDTLLADLGDFASHPQTGEARFVDFKMIMNKEDMSWSQYAPGTLTYRAGYTVGKVYVPAALAGNALQFFDVRTWNCTDTCGTSDNTPHAFNPNSADKLRVTISLNGTVQQQPSVTFTLLSWGNAQAASTPQCDGGFLYGRVQDGMYVFSFSKRIVAIPR